MHIVHICQFLGVGGLEQVLFLLIKEQLKLGHTVEVIVYDQDKRWVEKYRQLGITVHTDYNKKPGLDFDLVDYLENKIKNVDIIHTHDLNPAIYLCILKIKMFLKFKRFSFIHTTHGMEHIQLAPKTKLYEALLGLCAQKIICVSPKFKEYYQSQILTLKRKVHLIDNGVDIDKSFQKKLDRSLLENLNLNSEKPIAIYVARVVPLKGQMELINLYKELDHQLILVGPSGDDKYFNLCRNSLSDNIKMLGSREDIKELLDVANYYISHSFHEGLPISVLEAGSRKLPCLLFDIPGHSQFNKNRECVVLFNKNDFKMKLTYLEKNFKILIESFFSLIIDNYSIKAMAHKINRLYGEVKNVE